jgi:hypothetical protein
MLNKQLEILTIGYPFCAFKILTGLYCNFYPLIVLGIIDLIINTSNIFSLALKRVKAFDACLLSVLLHKLKKPNPEVKHFWEDFGNSMDLLLSFILVALMIGGNHIGKLPQMHLMIWNVSVILNVIGAGLSRVTTSFKNLA